MRCVILSTGSFTWRTGWFGPFGWHPCCLRPSHVFFVLYVYHSLSPVTSDRIPCRNRLLCGCTRDNTTLYKTQVSNLSTIVRHVIQDWFCTKSRKYIVVTISHWILYTARSISAQLVNSWIINNQTIYWMSLEDQASSMVLVAEWYAKITPPLSWCVVSETEEAASRRCNIRWHPATIEVAPLKALTAQPHWYWKNKT